MNSRAILLGIAALAGMSLPVRAQTVSYVFNLQPGYNAITTPLVRGGNTLNELFPNVPPGSALYKLQSGGGFETSTFDELGGGWNPNGTLLPGEGAFFLLTAAAPFQIIISGDKPVPHGQLNAKPGFNFVGCQGAEPCSFEQLMGFPPQPGDAVYHFDQPTPNPGGMGQGATRTNRFLATGWDVTPVIPPLRGVFVELASAPRVLVDPQRQAVALGGTATFNAIAINGTPRTFQWRLNGANLPGRTNSLLTITNVQPPNLGNYSVVVEFTPSLILTSLNARLSLAVPPLITRQPQSLISTQGKSTEFRVQASGTPPLYYQWMHNGAVFSPFAIDHTNLFFQNVTLADAGIYSVIVTNAAGSVMSTQAILTVLVPPRIIFQPQGIVVMPGDPVPLSATVEQTSTQPLFFQWLRNGNFIPGANGQLTGGSLTAFLTINTAQPDQSGVYRIIVANAAGAVLSDEAFVMVAGGDFNLGDLFPGPLLPPATGGLIQGHNLGASRQPGEPRHAGKWGSNSVWVIYRPTAPGVVTLTTRGSSFDTLLAAYTNNASTGLSEVASDDDTGGYLSSMITFSVAPTNDYHIAIDGLDDEQGRIVLQWQLESSPDRLPIITQHPQSVSVPRGAPAPPFTVSVQGPVDAFQWIFNGSNIINAPGPVPLNIPSATEANVGTYFARIRVGNHFISSRAAELELRDIDGPGQPPLLRAFDKLQDLIDTLAGTPPAARFSPASIVLGYTGSQTFSTAGAGGQNGEPIHCDAIGGHSKWYAYIPPISGTLFLNTDGSNFDTLLAVYTGCCTFATLIPVACDNNSGTNGLTSSLSFFAASNTVYYIAVDGVGGVTGSVKLNYRLLVPLMLANLSSTTNSLTFLLNATPQWPFTVQRSTNCITWTNFLTGTSASGLYLFTDTNLPPGRRFYRSIQTP